MKKFTNVFVPTLCLLVASFSVNASNPNFDDVNEPVSKPVGYDTNQECYASSVVDFHQGTLTNGNAITPSRSNPDMALYQPDASNAGGGFVSLGTDGYIILGFDGVIYDQAGNDFMIYETSFAGDNCTGSNNESALIEFSQDGITWVAYGEICLDAAIDIAGLGLEYVAQIKITNTASSQDGYDVDGVIAINGCSPEPRPCYASENISYTPGLQSNGSPMTNPHRIDPSKALGEPQVNNTENFVSLGYGGEIVVSFGGSVILNNAGDDLVVVETTFGNATFASYPESAEVLVSQNGVDFYYIGTAYTDQSASFDIDNAMTPMPLAYITQVKIVDITPVGSVSDDGYDLDGIIAINGCTEPDPVIIARCSPSQVIEYHEGVKSNGGTIDAIRTNNPNNVLGYPEGTDEYGVFTTLGYGGYFKLGFNGSVMNRPGDDLQFVETTFGRNNACVTNPEFADIFVSFDGYSWHLAGTVCKENNTIDISDAGAFEYINYVKVVNNDGLSTTTDAYDLDGVIIIGTCEARSTSTAALTNGEVITTMDAGIYPNPARGAATVSFVALENGNAGVELFDSYGRNVSTLLNKEVKAGNEYKVGFNAENLTNGIYFCKITNNNITETKKIVISH